MWTTATVRNIGAPVWVVDAKVEQANEVIPMRQIEVDRVRSVKGVLGLHRLRVEQLGPGSLRVELHLEVQRGLVIEAANDIAEEATHAIAGFTPGPNFITVHVDPERPAELRKATSSA